MVQETVQRVIEAAERAAGDGDALLSERREEREDPRQEVVRPLVTETVHRAAVDVQVVRVSEPAVTTVAAGDRATYLPRGKPRSVLTITIHSHRHSVAITHPELCARRILRHTHEPIEPAGADGQRVRLHQVEVVHLHA